MDTIRCSEQKLVSGFNPPQWKESEGDLLVDKIRLTSTYFLTPQVSSSLQHPPPGTSTRTYYRPTRHETELRHEIHPYLALCKQIIFGGINLAINRLVQRDQS